MDKNKEKILAIIIARGGSKSIPRKNVLPFRGKPLVAWPIELAKSVSRVDRVVVSTDDEEIAAIAKQYGAEVPFKRPPELARDETETLPVLQHCIKYLEEKEGYRPDIILLFYPTAPLLRKERVEEALDLFERTPCKSVLSVIEDKGRFWRVEADGSYKMFYPRDRVNRQYFQPLYRENGAIYFSRYDVLMHMNKLVDETNTSFVVVDEGENVDIDTPHDFKKAENM